MDSRSREALRAGDDVQLLRLRMRSGEISELQVSLASYAGCPVARELAGTSVRLRPPGCSRYQWKYGVRSLQYGNLTGFTCPLKHWGAPVLIRAVLAAGVEAARACGERDCNADGSLASGGRCRCGLGWDVLRAVSAWLDAPLEQNRRACLTAAARITNGFMDRKLTGFAALGLGIGRQPHGPVGSVERAVYEFQAQGRGNVTRLVAEVTLRELEREIERNRLR